MAELIVTNSSYKYENSELSGTPNIGRLSITKQKE